MFRCRSLRALVASLMHRRVLRFALVGGIGIPVNVGLLWLFHAGMRLAINAAWLLAFECSALLNFYANQRFTYHEQTHVRGMLWIRRALKAQLSSASGVLVNVTIYGILLAAGVRYLEADVSGIVAAFSANFALANRFVFTPGIRHTTATPLGELAGTILHDAHEDSPEGQITSGAVALCFANSQVSGLDDTADASVAPERVYGPPEIEAHSRTA